MKKNFITIFALINVLSFLTLFLESCENYDDSVPVHTATVEVCVNTNCARSAIPEKPENVSFTVTASNGKVNVSSSEPDESTGNYNLELPSEDANWTLSVKGFEGTGESAVQIYSGEGTVHVNSSGRYYKTVNVYYINDNEATGSCELEINVSDTEITYVKISGSGTAIDDNYSVRSGKIFIECDYVKTGNYSCTFQFYDSNNILLAAVRETINIRKNLVTGSWYKNGSEPYLETENGDTTGKAAFVLTGDIISQIANSTVYVSGSTEHNGSLTPSENPTGSWLAPYGSIQDAADRVLALNKIKSSEYTIFVDGDLTFTASDFDSGYALNIAPETSLKLTICGLGENPSILDADYSGSVLNINSASADVTVSNLTFRNASSGNSEINLSAGKLQLAGNVSVSGQIYKSDSSEIYVKDDLSGSEGIGLMLQSAVTGKTVVLKASENLIFTEAVCNKFEIKNTVGTTLPFCLTPSKLTGSDTNNIAVLALEGASNGTSSITFEVKKYALSFTGLTNDGNGNFICKAGDKITLSVCDSDGNAFELESYACTLYLKQTEKEFLTASNSEKSSECSINVPSVLPAGDYSVSAFVLIDGILYSAQQDFTIE